MDTFRSLVKPDPDLRDEEPDAAAAAAVTAAVKVAPAETKATSTTVPTPDPGPSVLPPSASNMGNDDDSTAVCAAAAVGEELPMLPSASWTVSGEGTHSALVGQVATFSIESFDATGTRRQQGGDKFAISLTGAATVRARVFDEGDGRYTCEFRCPSSGKYRLSVQAHSTHLPGSPFAVTVKANSLKEWKASRAKEAADLREKRKEQKEQKVKARPPSPRINPAEQLQRAYELALQAARGGIGGVSNRCHSKSSTSTGSPCNHLQQPPFLGPRAETQIL